MRKWNPKNHPGNNNNNKKIHINLLKDSNSEKWNDFVSALITTTRRNPATMSVISAVNCRYLITEGLMHRLKIALEECYGRWQKWVVYLGQENNTTEILK